MRPISGRTRNPSEEDQHMQGTSFLIVLLIALLAANLVGVLKRLCQ